LFSWPLYVCWVWIEIFPNSRVNICPKSFRPTRSFVKSIPGSRLWSQFYEIFATFLKKLAFFLKTYVMITILQKVVILKIITLCPGANPTTCEFTGTTPAL
jgi:hypothetical protein